MGESIHIHHKCCVNPVVTNSQSALQVLLHGIQALACRHEQQVAVHTVIADVQADPKQLDQADAVAVDCEDIRAILSVAESAYRRLHVAIRVAENAVGVSGLLEAVHAS